MLKRILLAGTSAAILLALVAAGASAGKGRFLRAMDTDGDGKVTVAEFEARGAERFAKIDTNGDGQLSQQEARNAKAKRREKFQAKFDTNKDGTVSPEEITAMFEERVQKHDRDGDGALSMSEYLAAHKGANAARFKRLDGDGDGKIIAREMAKKWTAHKSERKGKGGRSDKRFKRMDRNSDGTVSRAEYDQTLRAFFARLDRNKDGVLSGGDRRRGTSD